MIDNNQNSSLSSEMTRYYANSDFLSATWILIIHLVCS